MCSREQSGRAWVFLCFILLPDLIVTFSGSIICLILQMRRLRPREVKWFFLTISDASEYLVVLKGDSIWLLKLPFRSATHDAKLCWESLSRFDRTFRLPGLSSFLYKMRQLSLWFPFPLSPGLVLLHWRWNIEKGVALWEPDAGIWERREM